MQKKAITISSYVISKVMWIFFWKKTLEKELSNEVEGLGLR